jgi:uncharacterized membrane protein
LGKSSPAVLAFAFSLCHGLDGENHVATWPVATYGFVLVMAGIAYYILVQVLLAAHGANSALAKAIGADNKGKISVATYVVAIGLTFVNSWIAIAIYVAVAIGWLIPDRRIEKKLIH